MSEWPEALEKLKAIDVVDVIPGLRASRPDQERMDWFKERALHDEKLFPPIPRNAST